MAPTAEPASADLSPETLADLLWSTDPTLNAYMFRTTELLHQILRAEWPEQKGMLSHRNAFTISNDDKVEGLLVGHTTEEWPESFEASLVVQTRSLSDTDANALNAAIHWMDRLFPTPRDGSYYVLELAVAQSAQGKGLAKILLDAGIARARAEGCDQICLDVSADNPAVAFYEHLGFATEVETRVPYLDETRGIGLHYHMVRGLEPFE